MTRPSIELLSAIACQSRMVEESVRHSRGTESQEWYDVIVVAQAIDALIDKFPDAREEILRTL